MRQAPNLHKKYIKYSFDDFIIDIEMNHRADCNMTAQIQLFISTQSVMDKNPNRQKLKYNFILKYRVKNTGINFQIKDNSILFIYMNVYIDHHH